MKLFINMYTNTQIYTYVERAAECYRGAREQGRLDWREIHARGIYMYT